ncbi:MAG TPA: NADH-quinone oxidoreductase subunit L [Nevskiaceae bacterium]|nr:NADH-quinone oxidoreductase subunit L [Nevskiaceae bacterium]
MMDLLPFVFAFPLAGFVSLAFARGRMPEKAAAIVGVGSIGLSALLSALIGYQFLMHPPEGGAYVQVLWTWIDVDGFTPQFALRLDALSLVMLGVITGVGFLIHMYASWYMRGDDGYDRFFSYMNLFVASMLFLVLGDNLLFLYFGWEGVGLSSYLLIGFWYKDAANGAAARKAFVVTRVGDTFMAIGLFLLFHHLGTLNIQDAMAAATKTWPVGDEMATICALLILGGAVGKSAQLPLQTWLPDAMAGPTPVSALIHAATMVTAGVYLIARTHVLFELSPIALHWVGWIGAATALLAGFTALAQTDIKRVLAYSTMSQIGYMFLALGAGAYQPAIFHLMTHAFFKALLFLSAGSVILAMHHEQEIFQMGGLRKKIPFVFAVFTIGCLGLVAFPGTSGFFSKDQMLFEALAHGHPDLYYAGLFGAFLTAIYTSRLVFITFFGEPRSEHAKEAHGGHGIAHSLPLAVLAVLALLGGFIHLPLDAVLPEPPLSEEAEHLKHNVELMSMLVGFAGIGLAWLVFHARPQIAESLKSNLSLVWKFFRSAFGFDWLYDLLFVRPYLWFVHVNRNDGIDVAIGQIPVALKAMHGRLAKTQSGQTRWYVAAMGIGAVVLVAAVVILK